MIAYFRGFKAKGTDLNTEYKTLPVDSHCSVDMLALKLRLEVYRRVKVCVKV